MSFSRFSIHILITALAAILLLTAEVTAGDGFQPDPLGMVSPSRNFKTLHLKLDLELDLEGARIEGSVTHTLKALEENPKILAFNAVDLEIHSVEINGVGQEFSYPAPGSPSPSWLGTVRISNADEQLVVHPAMDIARGDTFLLKINYSGEPKQGLYFQRPEEGIEGSRYEVWSQGQGTANRFWIPLFDYPNDKFSYEGVFRVKKGYEVLSNGVLASRTIRGNKEEFHWKLDQPQVSYLIMVAAGEYDVHRDSLGAFPVDYWMPPGISKEMVNDNFARTPDMIEFFADYTGVPYPYGKYDQVVVQNFLYGGMENTTATVLTDRTLYDRPALMTRSSDYLVAHELAHMWFGDMLTCREWSQMWLNEGFATYFGNLYNLRVHGEDAWRYDMYRYNQIGTIENDKGNDPPRPLVTDFYNRIDGRNSNNVYSKGASVLYMLRHLLGDDAFREVIRAYAGERRHKTVETADLMRAVREVTGQNLDWFFEQWVFLAGHPRLKVNKRWDENEGLLKLTVEQTQEIGGVVPLFRLPVDIEIHTSEGANAYRIVIEDKKQEFYFACEEKPVMTVFDKGEWIVKEIEFNKPTGELLYQLYHGDYMSRVRAAKDLKDRGRDSRTIEALEEVILANGHYGLRAEAAEALGQIRTDAALDALIAGSEVGNARVRKGCAAEIGRYNNNDKAAERLVELARNDPAWEVRVAAIEALVGSEAPQAEEICVEALAVESNRAFVRNAGLEGLVKLEAVDRLDDIKPYTLPGNSRHHRHAAIEDFARLAAKHDDHEVRKQAALHLAGMLDDWWLQTRSSLVDALGELGEDCVLDDLRRIADHDPVEYIRRDAKNAADRIEGGGDHQETGPDVGELEKRLGDLEKEIDRIKREQALR